MAWAKFSSGNMMTSSNGIISRFTGYLCGEFTGPGYFPTQRPVTRSFDVFFNLRLNKRLSKQWWGWWFETLSRPLWRHRNEFGQYSKSSDTNFSSNLISEQIIVNKMGLGVSWCLMMISSWPFYQSNAQIFIQSFSTQFRSILMQKQIWRLDICILWTNHVLYPISG